MPDAPNTPSAPGQSPVAGASSAYPEPVNRLIARLAELPGIGRRSAERLAFHLLKGDEGSANALAQAILDVKKRVRNCRVCFNLSDAERCVICSAPASRRDHGLVLVVEQPRDLISLEQTGMYRGVYHVLMGHISPLDGIGPGDLTIAALLERIDHPHKNSGAPGESPTRVRELIMGLNPTMEGDGTALYLAQELTSRGVKVSRLARGLPTGSQIEFANRSVLADAIEGRQKM
ncbi:MAG: recombination mediator RecR [Phycisphaerales bacterium]